jgi:hypothetical protein
MTYHRGFWSGEATKAAQKKPRKIGALFLPILEKMVTQLIRIRLATGFAPNAGYKDVNQENDQGVTCD